MQIILIRTPKHAGYMGASELQVAQFSDSIHDGRIQVDCFSRVFDAQGRPQWSLSGNASFASAAHWMSLTRGTAQLERLDVEKVTVAPLVGPYHVM